MADVIKEFLVSLGVKVDEAGMRRFDGALKTLTSTTKGFVVTFVGLVATIEESLRRVGRSYEQLFYLSQQTGVSASNLKSLEFGFKQIGIQADQFHAAITQINREFVSSPGMKYFVANLVPGFNAATGTATDALIGFAEEYRKRMAMGEAAAAQYYNAISDITDAELVRHTAQKGNLEELKKGQEEALKIYKLYNFNADDASKKAAASMRQWNATWDVVKLGFDKLTLAVLNSDGFQNLMKKFLQWMEHDGIRIICGWITAISDWLNNPKNIEDWIEKFESIGRILIKLAGYVGDVVKAFLWLSDKIGPLEALGVAVFTAWILKITATIAITKALEAAFNRVTGAARAAQTAANAANNAPGVGGPGGGKSDIGAGRKGAGIGASLSLLGLVLQAMQMSPEERADTSKEGAIKKQSGIWEGLGVSPETSKELADPNWTQNTLKRWLGISRPGTYEGSPLPESGSETSYFELLFLGFQHWWAGSGAFRPFVALAEEVYTKFADMMRDVFGLNVGGSGTASPEGSPGPGGGRPGEGRPGGGGEGTQVAPPGSEGQYRPKYNLGEKDLSDAVINTIAGEATNSQESIDAVVNNMFNRLGTKAYGPSGNLEEVARAPGQYAGYKQAGPELAAKIRERIKAIASGTVADPTRGANEFRTASYMGPWGQQHADAPVIGGNRFAYNPAGGLSPYAPYSQTGGGPGGGPGSTGQAGAAPEQRGTRYGALGGGGDIKNLNTEFRENLNKAVKAAYEATGETINIISGYRSHEHQKQLHAASGGSGMVGKPGGSRHEYGIAADLDQRQARALAWLHQNADKFNLHFPLTGSGGTPREPWHIEPQWSRGGDWRGRSQRTNNVQAENNVEIHVHGVTDPHSAAEAAVKLQDRHAALNNATLEKMMT